MEYNRIFLLFGTLLILCYRLISGQELLELSCMDETQCEQFTTGGEKAHCMDGRCQCRSSNGRQQQCRPMNVKVSNIIGGPCPCKLPHAVCSDGHGICLCRDEYQPSVDRRRCIAETVPFGGACEIQSQCTNMDNFAVCNASSARCECKANFIQHDGVCLSILDTSLASCHQADDCHAKDALAFCASSTEARLCLCPIDYVSSTQSIKCIPRADYHGPCIDDNQCNANLGPGSLCRHGNCDCNVNYFPHIEVNHDGTDIITCKAFIERGAYCHNDEDCHQPTLGDDKQRMYCYYGECNCSVGYRTTNNTDCIPANYSSSRDAVHPAMLGLLFAFISLF